MGLYVDIEKKLKDFTLRVKLDTEGNMVSPEFWVPLAVAKA